MSARRAAPWPLAAALALSWSAAHCGPRQVRQPPRETEPPPFTAIADDERESLVPDGGLPEDPCRVPLATSTEALVAPGGVAGIQRALEQAGYLETVPERDELDEATLSAVRRFQKDEGLPVTGLPDYATVEALGLSRDEVFLRRTPQECAPAEQAP